MKPSIYSIERTIEGYVKRRRSEGWNDIDAFSIPYTLAEWVAIQKALQRSEYCIVCNPREPGAYP